MFTKNAHIFLRITRHTGFNTENRGGVGVWWSLSNTNTRSKHVEIWPYDQPVPIDRPTYLDRFAKNGSRWSSKWSIPTATSQSTFGKYWAIQSIVWMISSRFGWSATGSAGWKGWDPSRMSETPFGQHALAPSGYYTSPRREYPTPDQSGVTKYY